MNLKQFLDFYGINPDSLEKIKKRVFIVGKFNTAEKYAAAYLFSKSRRVDGRYKASCDLSYPSFIDVLQPTLTEYYKHEEIVKGESIPYFDLAPQEGLTEENNKDNSKYIIDDYNYFFQRAISTSEHPHFIANSKKTVELPEYTAGKTIYEEIRANLKKFCSFQHQNFDLIRCFAQLLHSNRTHGGIPNTYLDGQVLPVKFLPVFINFLYQEGTAPFSINDVDFAAQPLWETAISGQHKDLFISTFPQVVTAFKNYLRDPQGLDNQKIPDITLTPLREIVDEKLRLDFVAARNAYNMLRQITRSKVLLSMVLQWAIGYFYELNSVKKAISPLDKSRAIETAIKNGVPGYVAEPQKKLEEGNTVAGLIEKFKISFPVILEYVNTPEDKEKKVKFLQLSEFLQKIANNILEDEMKTSKVRLIYNMHPQQKKAALQALENFFVDVLIPRMFKEPGLTLDELKRKFSEYEEVLFQQSRLMDVADTNTITSLDRDENETFEQTLGRVVEKLIDVLVQDKVVEGFILTALTLENQATQRSLLPPTTSIGQMVPLLSPEDTAITSSYGESIELPLTEATFSGLALERDDTIEKIKRLPQSSFNQTQNLLNGPNTKLLKEGEQENEDGEEIKNDEPSGSLKALQRLQDTIIEKLKTDGQSNLNVALHEYAAVAKTNEQAGKLEVIKKIIAKDVKLYHYNLSRIYQKYTSANALPHFKSMVEAMTLCQLLLAQQSELNLDKAGTNLYDLLIDLVEHIHTPENPDLKAFFKKYSLTKYISANHFQHDGQGFSALESILTNQAEKSLENVKQYVSELQGIKYVFDTLEKEPNCEIVVINAYQNEFVNLVIDNINAGKRNFLNPAGLANNNISNPQFPIAVFMTDLSFNKKGHENIFFEKQNFLIALKEKFKTMGAAFNQNNIALLPPICISTGPADSKDWIENGKKLNLLTKDVYAPVLIIGPSLPLNSITDIHYKTTLSAGYVFCTHLLNQGDVQALELEHVNGSSNERFRVIGSGTFGITNTLKNLVEGPGELNYSFAADFYLYIIALLAASAKYSNKEPDFKALDIKNKSFWDAYYKMFNSYDELGTHGHADSQGLNGASLLKRLTDWTLSNDVSGGQELVSVDLYEDVRRNKLRKYSMVEWFNNLVEQISLKNPIVSAGQAK